MNPIFGAAAKSNNGISDDTDEMIKADILEEDTSYTIYVDVPGLTQKQVKLRGKDGGLQIKLCPENDQVLESKLIIEERLHIDAERLIKFECPIDAKTITATINKGVLIVNAQKVNDDDDSGLIMITEN